MIATVSLESPTQAGDVFSFDVRLVVTVGSEEIVYVSIDISPSSPDLTQAGVDYSAFSFTRSGAIATWDVVQEFGPNPFGSIAAYDTVTAPFTSGSYDLGKLSVDLALAGVPFDPSLVVSIKGTFTELGAQEVNVPSTFDFVPVNFAPGAERELGSPTPNVVPEPATAWIVGTLLAFISARTRRPRKESQ